MRLPRWAMTAILGFLAAALLPGCAPTSIETGSGLHLTVPAGSSIERRPRSIGSEAVQVTPLNGAWTAVFISFADEALEPMTGRVLASSDSSEVVVYANPSDTEAVVETRLPGHKPGRVLILPTTGRSGETTGLPLAQAVWTQLQVGGAELP